jgi:hypothetical protein
MKLEALIGKDIPDSAFKLGPGMGDGLPPLVHWTGITGMLCAPGCEAQTFMLLASFAAPLLSLYKTAEGGGVVSIFGGRRAGKATALMAAGSVWGPPGALSVKMYDKHRLTRISRMCNLPVICDGMMNTDPGAARGMVLTFLTAPDGWSTLMLSATGTALFPTIMEARDARPGFEAPVKVPAHLIQKDGSIERTLVACRGWAGLTYLRYLVDPNVILWCRMMLTSTMAEWREQNGLGDESRFVLRTIAAVHVAGMIVSKLGIVDVQPERITDWALKQGIKKKDKAA